MRTGSVIISETAVIVVGSLSRQTSNIFSKLTCTIDSKIWWLFVFRIRDILERIRRSAPLTYGSGYYRYSVSSEKACIKLKFKSFKVLKLYLTIKIKFLAGKILYFNLILQALFRPAQHFYEKK
jgi:hypothetical protein